jgi:osmotically-inducible protein OsmY
MTKYILMTFLILALGSCTSTLHRESAGEYVDNAAISAKIKSKLLTSKKVSGTAIDVESYKGAIILSGFVENDSERDSAIEIARKVRGVKMVKDALYVKSDIE